MGKVTKTGTKVKVSKKEAKAALRGFTALFREAAVCTKATSNK